MLINEVLYMQVRIFRLFCDEYKINSKRANEIFNANKIWEYIDECYGLLHLSGDEVAIDDISHILLNNGVQL